MENKNKNILILYLHPDAFQEGKKYGNKEILRLIKNDGKSQVSQLRETSLTGNGLIAKFMYENKDYAFVLTKENKDESEITGVRWPILKEILNQSFPGLDLTKSSVVAQHIENVENLEIPIPLAHYVAHAGLDNFHDIICNLLEKFGDSDFESCLKIMQELSPMIKVDQSKKNQSSESSDDKSEVTDIQDIQQFGNQPKTNSTEEIIIVMCPDIDKEIISDLPEKKNKLFFLIEQKETGNDFKNENTTKLIKYLKKYRGSKIYLSIHDIPARIVLMRIIDFVKKENQEEQVFYCNFHRTPDYDCFIMLYTEVIENLKLNQYSKVTQKFDQLKKTIEDSYWDDGMINSIDRAMALFMSLDMDLKGLAKVKDERKGEYFLDIKNSLKQHGENISTYFNQKLADLRLFVSGAPIESKVASSKSHIEMFNRFNLTALKKTDDRLTDDIEIVKKLSGFNENLSPIEKFIIAFDKLLEGVCDQSIGFEITDPGIFQGQWQIGDKNIMHFSDWFILLIGNLNSIKEKILKSAAISGLPPGYDEIK